MSMAKVYLDSCMIIGLIEGDATLRQTLHEYSGTDHDCFVGTGSNCF